jgi:glucosylceramidase
MAIKAVEGWVTSENKKFIHKNEVGKLRPRGKRAAGKGAVQIDLKKSGQSILGFGAIFTDAAVYHFARMSPKVRHAALTELFDPVKGAGWNLMRIPFGSSDWDRNWNFYTYSDMPPGKKDPTLAKFSIQEDIKRDHIKIIKEAMAINPELKIFASVWGPPAWMKDNDQLISYGAILPKYYRVYARYLCKSVQAYEAQGIPILAVSPQNEPLCNDGRKTPQALWMEWKPMRDFHLILADEFAKQKIKSQIWAFDHNFCYIKKYVRPLLKDARLRAAIDGVAWHDYEGEIPELGKVAKEFPDMPMYHTERALYKLEHIGRIVELLKNGCRSHNHWTTLQDEYGGPHQFVGGSEKIKEPLKETEQSALVVLRKKPNHWYTTIGHHLFSQISQFIKRGAVRLETHSKETELNHVAFRNVDGTIILISVNTSQRPKKLELIAGESEATFTLPARSVGTYCFW